MGQLKEQWVEEMNDKRRVNLYNAVFAILDEAVQARHDYSASYYTEQIFALVDKSNERLFTSKEIRSMCVARALKEVMKRLESRRKRNTVIFYIYPVDTNALNQGKMIRDRLPVLEGVKG